MGTKTDDHFMAVKRVLRYLKGAPGLCVKYSKNFSPHGCCDARHGDDPSISRSVSGYLHMFAGEPVAWTSNNKPVVALSSCESKRIALAYEGQETVYPPDLWSNLSDKSEAVRGRQCQ